MVTLLKRWAYTVTVWGRLRGKERPARGSSTYRPGARRTLKRPSAADRATATALLVGLRKMLIVAW
jgi:hypothetical protein